MASDERPALRPGAGRHEIELYIDLLRDELEGTLHDIGRRLDVRWHALRVAGSFRRDVREAPGAFGAVAAVVGVVGAWMLATSIRDRRRNRG